MFLTDDILVSFSSGDYMKKLLLRKLLNLIGGLFDHKQSFNFKKTIFMVFANKKEYQNVYLALD